jgi:hypothetical protein
MMAGQDNPLIRFNSTPRKSPYFRNRRPQPGQPRLAALFAAQRIETLALFGGQSVGQPTMCFSARMMAKGGAEPLKRGGRRRNNTAFAATPNAQLRGH